MMTNTDLNPLNLLNQWLEEEHRAGAPNPQQAVLSTSTNEAVPHARVVAIREIDERGFLFFTQQGTRKFAELTMNPIAVITFWLELWQREVIVEGIVEPLAETENQFYWQHYPREAQIRFYSYAPTSAQPIANKQALEEKKRQIELDYSNKPLPISPFYRGFRLEPAKIIFYAYRTDELSDVMEYRLTNNHWFKRLLSP